MRQDRGSASVLVLSLVAVLGIVSSLLLGLGAIAVARHRAASAADLGALAAAGSVLDGEAAACARAVRVAQAAGARVHSCGLRGDTARVIATVALPGRLAPLGPARATALAGPERPTPTALAGPERPAPAASPRPPDDPFALRAAPRPDPARPPSRSPPPT